MAGASDAQAREFATAFRSFLEWIHSESGSQRNEVVALVADHLGEGAHEQSVVARSLPPFEQVNLQTALDRWSRESGREVAVHGLTIPPHHPPVTLQQLLTGEGMPWLRLSAPALSDLPNGPDSTLAGLRAARAASGQRLARPVRGHGERPSDHSPSLDVEIAGLPVDTAQAARRRPAADPQPARRRHRS
jgi:hypothetical protein